MCCWAETNAPTALHTDPDCDPVDGQTDCNRYDNSPGNTDVCLIDLSKSPSNQVNGGIAIYPNNTEGSVHCHGIAWETNENHWNSLLKGNNLFHASMIQMRNEGYMKSFPGAPMCGCVEQMPIITRADCTEAVVSTKFVFQYSAYIPELKAYVYKHRINHRECQGHNKTNDLSAFYEKLWSQNQVQSYQKQLFDSIVVGENGCNDATSKYLQMPSVKTPLKSAAPTSVKSAAPTNLKSAAPTKTSKISKSNKSDMKSPKKSKTQKSTRSIINK